MILSLFRPRQHEGLADTEYWIKQISDKVQCDCLSDVHIVWVLNHAFILQHCINQVQLTLSEGLLKESDSDGPMILREEELGDSDYHQCY